MAKKIKKLPAKKNVTKSVKRSAPLIGKSMAGKVARKPAKKGSR